MLCDQDVLKISDFGLSNAIVDQDTLLQTHCGSEKYAAPEIMGSSAEYKGAPIDIWYFLLVHVLVIYWVVGSAGARA